MLSRYSFEIEEDSRFTLLPLFLLAAVGDAAEAGDSAAPGDASTAVAPSAASAGPGAA